MTSPLSAFFAPRGVIVVGASRSPGKLGTAMADALAEGSTPVALVNRSGADGMASSVGAAAEQLAAIGAVADLVISCVPAPATASVIREAGEASIWAALVCAGGFGEIGIEGAASQADLIDATQTHSVRVLGPNTSGFFVPPLGLRASFVPGVAHLRAGRVAVVASSGGVNHMLAFRLASAGVGVSLGVGIGVGLGVSHADVLDYLATDAATTAIALHLETVADGPALLSAVRRVSAVKPVVALVVGRRTESAFAQSHTGSLATSWRTTRAVLAQAGAVVVDDEDQLVAAVTALSRVRLAPNPRAGVGLVTAQAGPGLILDDHAHDAGWVMPTLAAATQTTIARHLPPLTFQSNPVDTGRPGDSFPPVLRAVSDDPAIDLIAVYALIEPVVDLPRAVDEAGCSVPVLMAVDGPASDIDLVRQGADARGLALLTGPSALGFAVSAVVRDAHQQFLVAGTESVTPMLVDHRGAWDEVRGKDLLDSLGLATPPRRRVSDRTAARAALTELGGPVAVKLVDTAVLHKTEMGGVHLGVASAEALDGALDALIDVGASEFLIEKMVEPGVDLIVSARRDPVFGPVVLVGVGGTRAEADPDVVIGSVPLSRAAAEALVDGMRARDLLLGWRGGATLNRVEFARVVEALGAALIGTPMLDEIEINPLRLTRHGLVALDAVVITVKEDGDDQTHA